MADGLLAYVNGEPSRAATNRALAELEIDLTKLRAEIWRVRGTA
jgi:hypothetical protein